MQPPGLLRGLLLLLGLAAVLFTFNQTRLLARSLAAQRLDACRLLAEQVRADAEADLFADLERLAAEPALHVSPGDGEVATIARAAQRQGLGPGATIQMVSVGQALRVVSSGPFNPGMLWDAMRGALEHGKASGIEHDPHSGELALVGAVRRPAAGGTTAAIALARPLDDSFVERIKASTGVEVSLYSLTGAILATTLADADGQRLADEPPAVAAWRSREEPLSPFVTAGVSHATLVSPIRSRGGEVIGVQEMTAALPYGEAFRRLPRNGRFVTEILFLALAGLMAMLLARSGANR